MKKISSTCLSLIVTLLCASAAFAQDVTAINFPEPLFPPEAKTSIYGTSVIVVVNVDKKGKVTEAQTSGPLRPCSNLNDPVAATIKQAAIEAAKQAVFQPILKDGKPIEIGLRITYEFKSKDEIAADLKQNPMISGGVLNGKAKSLPKPDYPAAAKVNRASGSVAIQVLVNEDGRIISAQMVSGHPLLGEAAVEAACRSKFASTTLAGQPVKVSGVITYNFVP